MREASMAENKTMKSPSTESLDGLGFGAPPCSDIFDHLDRIQERAMKINDLAVDACRCAKFSAYTWLIREYRRKRIAWDALAGNAQVADEKRCMEWDVDRNEYARYLDLCRESFGLPVRHRLADLPGAEDRRESLICERDRELEEDRAKYDPYCLNVPRHLPRKAGTPAADGKGAA